MEPLNFDSDKFLEANRDYIDRIGREGVEVIYDGTLDTLFVEFGGAKEAVSEHAFDNIMLRISPQTMELVGCEILDFLEDFVPNHRIVTGWAKSAGLALGEDSHFTLSEPQARVFGEMIMGGAVPEMLARSA